MIISCPYRGADFDQTAGPVNFNRTVSVPPTAPIDYQALWNDLHTKVDTHEQFLVWVARVPSFGCSCAAWLRDYLSEHPYPVGTQIEVQRIYGWQMHNAVNEKLGKPEFSWEQFQLKYPTWKQSDGFKIGFAVVNYESLGGTETFHQTLVPRLENVIGFASLNDLRGDASKLGVPSGQGIGAIASLSLQCDVVVSWNIDWETLQSRPKRVIAVHHGSLSDSEGMRLCLQGDEIVCVNREVAEHLRTLTAKPVYCIEPAVDPSRLIPRESVDTKGQKICLWSHRFSDDKRYHLAVDIAQHLPADWHMVLTGYRGERISTNNRVTILPPTHPGDWLSVASCFLSTTIFEGFGLSVAEAITAGVPVVSTPTGIASRPGLAITVPIDASPSEWAKAIATSGQHKLPRTELFSLADKIEAWTKVVQT